MLVSEILPVVCAITIFEVAGEGLITGGEKEEEKTVLWLFLNF